MGPEAMGAPGDPEGVEDVAGDVDGQNPEKGEGVEERVNQADHCECMDDEDVERHIRPQIVLLQKLNHCSH